MTQREQFEAAYLAQWGNDMEYLGLHPDTGEYRFNGTRRAWEWWQAAQAAMTPQPVAQAEQARFPLPEILFNGYGVWHMMTPEATRRTSPENVSDVLDALVKWHRAQPPAEPTVEQDLADPEYIKRAHAMFEPFVEPPAEPASPTWSREETEAAAYSLGMRYAAPRDDAVFWKRRALEAEAMVQYLIRAVIHGRPPAAPQPATDAEPVAWRYESEACGFIYTTGPTKPTWPWKQPTLIPLFAHPPRPEPLSAGEINEVYMDSQGQELRPQDKTRVLSFARALEAAIRAKGTP
ncbi:MAG: hypothetical protein Q7T97_02310 [Burkholderiaceae bacterium]|nr:hypothetical protein [Burkholderiaceae bacterium]